MIALTSIIPAPYRWLMLAVAAAAIWGHGWLAGAEHGEDKLNAYKADVDRQTLIQAARSLKASTKLLQDGITREKAKNDEINDINRRLSIAVADSVRYRAERRRVATPNPTTPASCDGATGAELSRPDAEFSVREAARADRIRAALKTCYEQYNQARDTLEALTKPQ